MRKRVRSVRHSAEMTKRVVVVLTMLVACMSGPMVLGQDRAPPGAVPVTAELEPTIRSLLHAIEILSDYSAPAALPSVFRLPQSLLEAKVCEEPCSVTAAYLPREGVYLAENLDPERDPQDSAVLLHELVHYLQQGHPKFAHMSSCQREKTKEQEAYAIQNAYLAMIGSGKRAVFYDGEFDCPDEQAAGSR